MVVRVNKLTRRFLLAHKGFALVNFFVEVLFDNFLSILTKV